MIRYTETSPTSYVKRDRESTIVKRDLACAARTCTALALDFRVYESTTLQISPTCLSRAAGPALTYTALRPSPVPTLSVHTQFAKTNHAARAIRSRRAAKSKHSSLAPLFTTHAASKSIHVHHVPAPSPAYRLSMHDHTHGATICESAGGGGNGSAGGCGAGGG